MAGGGSNGRRRLTHRPAASGRQHQNDVVPHVCSSHLHLVSFDLAFELCLALCFLHFWLSLHCASLLFPVKTAQALHCTHADRSTNHSRGSITAGS